MRYTLASLALALLAAPGLAQPVPPALTLEQASLLRCSVAFALVAGDQQRGDPAALEYPPLAERGREFFARANARLMDEAHLTRDQLEALVHDEVERFRTDVSRTSDPQAYVRDVMEPCLTILDASGL